MVILPQPTSLAATIGKGLGQGVERGVQTGLLQNAFANLKNLPQGSSLVDMIGTVGPQLLQTPGGAQLLGELAPLLQKEAIMGGYESAKSAQPQTVPGIPQSSPTQAIPSNIPMEQKTKPMKTDLFKTGEISPSKESTYPQQAAQPSPPKLMTPEEMMERERYYAEQFRKSGALPDPGTIQGLVQKEQEQRLLNIKQYEQERSTREEAQAKASHEALARFQASGVGETPEDNTVFEKFYNDAYQGGARDPNSAYQAARTNYRKFDAARKGIRREIDLSGPIFTAARKLSGTYKDADSIIKDLQPMVKEYKELGLVPELRDELSGLGLGPEQIESTIFHPSKQEMSVYNRIPPNKNYKPPSPKEQTRNEFPGSESVLNTDQFVKFKDYISDILNNNPDTNLLTLRGYLNQDKKYAWQDINRAVQQLIDEGDFSPNNYQFDQLNVLKSPPLPGLISQFQYLWKGKK